MRFATKPLWAVLVVCVVAPLACTLEETTTPTDPTSSNTNEIVDPGYEETYQLLGDAQELGRTLLNSTWWLLDSVVSLQPDSDSCWRRRHQGGTALGCDSVELVYHENSGYWWQYRRFGEDTEAGSPSLTVIDSLQFVSSAGPVQWPEPGQLLDFAVGGYVAATYSDGGIAMATHDLYFTGDALNGEDVIVSGLQTFLMDYSRDYDSCAVYLDVIAYIDEVAQPSYPSVSSTCPRAGEVQYDGEVTMQCYGSRGGGFSDWWGISQTFLGDGMAHYVVINSTDEWTFVGDCY